MTVADFAKRLKISLRWALGAIRRNPTLFGRKTEKWGKFSLDRECCRAWWMSQPTRSSLKKGRPPKFVVPLPVEVLPVEPVCDVAQEHVETNH